MKDNYSFKFAIVVVAYNRPDETKRLVDSICLASYDEETVDLIIDIDKGPRQTEIVSIIKDINWNYGELKVVVRQERMGLRPHVFACGNYTEQYDAVVVLEDDLIVSPEFYHFSKEAAKKYCNEEKIAEISLYSYAVNEFEARPFYPAKSGWDVFAMQVVQSWGQCWTRRMWNAFKESEFYIETNVADNPKLHNRVNSWGKNSWKKNFANYIVNNGLFVIYPYDSYTTNYSEAGEHCKRIVSDYQVCMQMEKMDIYKMPEFDKSIKYDSFFERILDDSELTYSEMCIDIYGSKTNYEGKRYLASTRRLPFHVLQEYGLVRKPCEINVLCKEPGQGIYIYDLSMPSDSPTKNNDNILVDYDYGYLSWKRSLQHGINGLKRALSARFGKQ